MLSAKFALTTDPRLHEPAQLGELASDKEGGVVPGEREGGALQRVKGREGR